MFIGVAVVCLGLVAANWIAWYRSTKSLAACIADANAAAQRDPLGKTYAPLTEDYVYFWLQAYIDNSDGPAELKAELRRVVRTGRLPNSAQLEGEIGHSVTRGWFKSTRYRFWNHPFLAVICVDVG